VLGGFFVLRDYAAASSTKRAIASAERVQRRVGRERIVLDRFWQELHIRCAFFKKSRARKTFRPHDFWHLARTPSGTDVAVEGKADSGRSRRQEEFRRKKPNGDKISLQYREEAP
jgi:hypothetical protein